MPPASSFSRAGNFAPSMRRAPCPPPMPKAIANPSITAPKAIANAVRTTVVATAICSSAIARVRMMMRNRTAALSRRAEGSRALTAASRAARLVEHFQHVARAEAPAEGVELEPPQHAPDDEAEHHGDQPSQHDDAEHRHDVGQHRPDGVEEVDPRLAERIRDDLCHRSPHSKRGPALRSEEHTSELQSLAYLVC